MSPRLDLPFQARLGAGLARPPAPRPGPPFFIHAQAGVLFGNELEQAGGRPGPAPGLRLLPAGIADVGLRVAWQRWSGLPIGDAGTLDVDRDARPRPF